MANLTCEPLLPEIPVARLLEAVFAAIVAQRVEAADADATIRHIAQTGARPGDAGRGALFGMAICTWRWRWCRRHLLQPDLSPAQVGRTMNISVRQLHLLFEPTDKSFSRTLLAMRLVEARRQLESVPHLTVTEIALACGFDSLATFYRTFRQTYGGRAG